MLVIINYLQLNGQPSNLKFDHIGLEQGLSQSTVTAIIQDNSGFIWFGTDDGLNRYDGYSIKVFKHNPNNSNSVADNSIVALLNDSNGDLWIGSRRGGVDRYDIKNNKFYHYTHNSDDSSTISDNSVSTLFKDSQGNIWIGTRKGFNRHNYSDNTFTRFNIYSADSPDTNSLPVIAIGEDSSGNLWIGTSIGLFRINLKDKGRKETELDNIEPVRFLSGLYIRTLYIDRFGVLWAGTFGSGLFRYSIEKNDFSQFADNSKSTPYSEMGNFVFKIYEDSKNNFWVAAYDSGLSVHNRKTGNYQKWLNESVHVVFEDNSGIIWIGTYADGVKTYDERKNRFHHSFDKSSGAREKDNNIITSILEDSRGYLWVGTYNKGLKLYSPPSNSNGRIRRIIRTFEFENNNPYSLSSNKVISLCESSDGNIWVSTETDGLNMFDHRLKRFIRHRNKPGDSNSPASDRITSLFFDREENLLWIGYLDGTVDSYNPSNGSYKHYRIQMKRYPSTAVNSVTAIYKGIQSGLCIGTYDGDLNRFMPGTDSFQQFYISDSNTDINRNGIYSMYEDNEGILWIGTFGGGLKRLDLKRNIVKIFTDQDGLPNNVVYSILPDNKGNLWLSTNKGISNFNPLAGTFRNYDVKDGTQSNEFNQGAYFTSKSGELFFGGVSGFNAFFPDEIVDNTYIPPVHITTIRVFDEVLPLPDPLGENIKQIELSYSQNYFSFEFVALNYTSSEKNRYSYILEGFDKDWHTASANQRYASYTNLNPGNYHLKVKASNNDGIWNETGASIAIVITPPFWMTWWFRGLAVLLVLLSLFFLVRYFTHKKIMERTRQIEQEKAIEKERLRIARDMHDDLGARLTEIRFLTEIARTESESGKDNIISSISETANDMISNFREIVWSVSPQNDTVESLAEYIGQYAVDYLSKAHIRCRLDLPREFPCTSAPAEVRHNVFLAVKESLNNIVKYAHTPEVNIKIFINDAAIKIHIQDFGKGFNTVDESLSGNGLKNMNKRIEQAGGNFILESIPGIGTKIIMSVPLERNSDLY